MNENPQVREWDKINKGFKTRIRPKVEMEGEAAKVAAILCYGTYNK